MKNKFIQQSIKHETLIISTKAKSVCIVLVLNSATYLFFFWNSKWRHTLQNLQYLHNFIQLKNAVF